MPEIPAMFAVSMFPLGVAGLWCGVCWLLSVMGGWSRLAERFPARGEPTGQSYRIQSARFGWVNYSGCLTIHASHDGVRIAVWPLFRIGHPPLFIPRREMTDVRERKVLWLELVRFTVDARPPVTIELAKHVFASKG